MNTEYKIKICSNHDYQVPLIWTFAFIGAEYWCPYCGYINGMFGAGEDVTFTWKLHSRLIKYKRLSRTYLKANSMISCAKLKYKGEWVKFNELPKRSRNYWLKKSKEWEYKK